MGTTESTHEVAEKTGPSGQTTRVETDRVETSETNTSPKPKGEADDAPKQIKPDGR